MRAEDFYRWIRDWKRNLFVTNAGSGKRSVNSRANAKRLKKKKA